MRRSRFSWGMALALAVLLVIPAFIGSIPVAEATPYAPVRVTAASTGVGATTSYTLEFQLQDGQSLKTEDTVYLRTCYIEADDYASPGSYNFAGTTATIADAVYSSTTVCQPYDLPGEPPYGTGLSFTIEDEFEAGPGAGVTIELNNVVNPLVAEREWYWELGINDPEQATFTSISSPLTITRTGVDLYVTYGDGSPLPDDYYLDLTAGEVQELKIQLLDQDGKPCKASTNTYLIISEERGGVQQPGFAPNFYMENPAENSQAEPIHEGNRPFIPQGEDSVSIWYLSTQATGFIEGYSVDGDRDWCFYDDEEVEVAFGIEGDWYWTYLPLRVAPGEPTEIVAKLHEADLYDGNKIRTPDGTDNWGIELPGMIGPGDVGSQDPDRYYIKPNSGYEVSIGLLDLYGNPTAANTERVIKVILIPEEVEFYDEYWNPIGDIDLSPGELWTSIYLSYIAEDIQEPVEKTVSFRSQDMIEAEFDIVVESPPSGLAFYVLDRFNPLDSLYETHEGWRVNEAWAWNDLLTPCIVAVIDRWGRPTTWNGAEDLKVALQGDEGGFCMTASSGSVPVSNMEITIPKGYTGIGLYYLRPQPSTNPLVDDRLLAAALREGESVAWRPAITRVKLFPHWMRPLSPGWNVVSTPVALERARFDQFITDLVLADNGKLLDIPFTQETVEIAYSFDPVLKTWHQIYRIPDGNGSKSGLWVVQQGSTPDYDADPVFLFEPMKAIYVKIKATNLAGVTCYAASTPTGPYASILEPGWNLVGPALDISYKEDQMIVSMPVDRFIKSVYSNCLQIVSPALGIYNSRPWNFVPDDEWYMDDEDIPHVLAGSGLWMYMGYESELAGFSYTPVQHLWSMFDWGGIR
ncbi:MAG: hypothetical protein ACOX4Q_05585 [Syntrophomonadales bacterium]